MTSTDRVHGPGTPPRGHALPERRKAEMYFKFIRWLDFHRQRLAVLLAPWAVYPDIREYHGKP